MPSNLTDISSFDPVSAPIATDIRNAASVRAALQTVANRTRFLYDRTTPLANVAALKALTGMADGTVRLVKGIGFFVYDSASAVAEALPYIAAPTAGSGRWLHDHAAFWKTTRSVFERARPAGNQTNWGPGSDSSPGLTAVGAGVARVLLTELHDGAKLSSVDVYFVPATGHVGLPANRPTCEVFLYDTSGPTNCNVTSPGGGYSTFPAPANVAAYEGSIQHWNIPMIDNVVIDRSIHFMEANFATESGANAIAAGMRLVGFRLNFVNIPDLRFP